LLGGVAVWVALVGVSLVSSAMGAEETKVKTKVNPTDGAEMVWIPGGEFMMGSDPAEIDRLWQKTGWAPIFKGDTTDEQPKHRVKVEGFWMYNYEVTAGQYRKFCKATGHAEPSHPSWGKQPDDHPVVLVSWHDAQGYCQWAEARLPTEAEWEYAAKGGEDRVFPWGNEWDRKKANSASFHVGKDLVHFALWMSEFAIKKPWETKVMTTPGGKFPANPYGLYDLAGNVWEWCEDWYDRYPDSTEKSENFGEKYRVVRGGGWFAFLLNRLRCGNRGWFDPEDPGLGSGFRCVVSGEDR